MKSRLKNWVTLWVQLTFSSFAGILTFSVFSDQGIPDVPSSMAEVAAPLLAFSAAVLGLVSGVKSQADVSTRVRTAAIWIIAILSAYFWFASTASVNRHPGDLGFVADTLKLFDAYIVIGLLLAVLVEAIRRYRSKLQVG